MSCAARNRQIKKVLQMAFGQGRVRVRGSRGTAYGWVTIQIDYSPRSYDEASTLRRKVSQLLRAADCSVGTYGYDDPGSDYGYGERMHVNFGALRDMEDD